MKPQRLALEFDSTTGAGNILLATAAGDTQANDGRWSRSLAAHVVLLAVTTGSNKCNTKSAEMAEDTRTTLGPQSASGLCIGVAEGADSLAASRTDTQKVTDAYVSDGNLTVRVSVMQQELLRAVETLPEQSCDSQCRLKA